MDTDKIKGLLRKFHHLQHKLWDVEMDLEIEMIGRTIEHKKNPIKDIAIGLSIDGRSAREGPDEEELEKAVQELKDLDPDLLPY